MDEENRSNVITFRPRKPAEESAAHHEADHVYLTMLYALTEHVANKLGIKQDTIQAMVVTALGIRNFEQLQKDDFESASKYIVDLLNDHASIH